MGHGIAAIFAAAGHRVALHDPDAPILASAEARIAAIFDLLAWDRSNLPLLRYEPDFAAAVVAADFVFEAGPEKLEVKRAIFKHLGRGGEAGLAILCTNTSAIPDRPDRRRNRRPLARRRHPFLEPAASCAVGGSGAGQ